MISYSKIIYLVADIFFLMSAILPAQSNRIAIYNGQQIFSSGMNMAWGDFARDATNLNEATFIQMFDEIKAAGGNTVRWWLHVNGTNSPQYSNDTVSGIGQTEIDNVLRILDLAFERKMTVCISLWSHDMLNGNNGDNFRVSANQFMLADSAATMAYINNALIPLVDALRGHPGIFCWEIFNEPEGMISGLGWTGSQPGGAWTTYPNIKRFTNLATGAIHRTDPNALVTMGTHRIAYISEALFTNHYADSVLISHGGDSLGTLDFYQVHYYSNFGSFQSPFAHPYSYWELDKPLVVGEFSAHGPNGSLNSPSPQEAYQYLFDNGYAGAWSWTWTGHDGNGNVDDAAEGMLPLAENYPQDILIHFPAGFIEEFELEKDLIAVGDSVRISWVTSDSSIVTINGENVQQNDITYFAPDTTTHYSLIASGEMFADTVHFTINVLQLGEILFFTAASQSVELGDSTLLKWHVVGENCCSYVTLNGDSVSGIDSLYVYPVSDTTFTLATNGPSPDTASVEITVLTELAVNRALSRPVHASTFESCCGSPLVPELAVDGNESTRWSSAWGTGDPADANTDDNPNDEWIYVDLQGFYNLSRVIISWETAHAESYNIDISSDAINWTTIDSIRGKSSPATDERSGLQGVARFVRIHGINRATIYGYSIYEFQVYGTTITEAVVTTYADDFENSILDGWDTIHDSTFGLTEGDGVLTINYNRTSEFSEMWDNFNFTPLAMIDASENPIITVRVRSTVSTQLQLKPIYTDGGEDWNGLSSNLLSNNQWQTLTFNLQNADAPMSIIYLYLDGGSITPSSGVVQFDYITIGTEIEDPVSVEETIQPLVYELHNAYPNPFNPSTKIEFTLKKSQRVNLTIYDILGQEVKVLFDGDGRAGKNNFNWDATNSHGGKVSTGIYFYRLRTETGFIKTKKVLLIK
jgi:hypothetical protein